ASGGGIENNGDRPTITNCTFAGNRADYYGGGIQNNAGSPSIKNCTFAGNTASSGYGGGIDNEGGRPTSLNCILWGDAGREVSLFKVTSFSLTYSDVQGGWPLGGTGNLNSDPLFVRTPSPGTDGHWGTEDDDYGDLRLRATSPAIDHGSDAA